MKNNWPPRIAIITHLIIVMIAGLIIGWNLAEYSISTKSNSTCEKQIEELQIEYEARQSTYEMDYRTCEIKLQEALEMNEYLKRRIRSFNTN